MTDPGEPTVTVVIPTFDGEETIGKVLDVVFDQESALPFEVLVIDSGSRDRTVEIVKRHPVRLIEIPNREFGHGKTRNLAVEISNSLFITFLTQDAIPASRQWLDHLVHGFDLDPNVAAVYGPHIPRADADPKTKRDLVEFFAGMGGPDRPMLQSRGDPTFFSDVNGCIKKEIWKLIPYRDLSYAEDQAFGKDILEAGYLKVFEPRAAVIHSHSYPPMTHFRRQFDEWVGLKVAIGITEEWSLLKVMGGTVRGSLVDGRLIWAAKEYQVTRRLRFIGKAIVMNLARRLGSYLAARHESLPEWLKNRLSHERSWKRKRQRA